VRQCVGEAGVQVRSRQPHAGTAAPQPSPELLPSLLPLLAALDAACASPECHRAFKEQNASAPLAKKSVVEPEAEMAIAFSRAALPPRRAEGHVPRGVSAFLSEDWHWHGGGPR